MNTQDIANKLVEYCRTGQFQKCYEELYDNDCVSIEPTGAMLELAEGMEAIHKKGKKWNEMVEEMHSAVVLGMRNK
jgi:chemotaxis response regulator CheB